MKTNILLGPHGFSCSHLDFELAVMVQRDGLYSEWSRLLKHVAIGRLSAPITTHEHHQIFVVLPGSAFKVEKKNAHRPFFLFPSLEALSDVALSARGCETSG